MRIEDSRRKIFAFSIGASKTVGMDESASDTSSNIGFLTTKPPNVGNVLEHHRPYLRMLARTRIHDELRSKLDPSDVVQEVCVEQFAKFSFFEAPLKPNSLDG